jgi:hypothetical protein
VRSYPDYQDITPDSGYVSFRNFIGDNTDIWERSEAPEALVLAGDTLTEIADRAASFILGRQAATGLLTTWEEDFGSSLTGITVFPNPADSYIFIQFPVARKENTRISVRDISGRIVLIQELPAFQHSASLDVAGLGPGVYIIDFGSSEGMKPRKLAVQFSMISSR